MTQVIEQTMHIVVNLSKGDRQRIDELISIGSMIAAALGTKAHEPATPLFVVEPAEEHPVDAVSPHGEPETAAEPEMPKYTKDDVLAKVQSLAGPNNPKREQAKAIIKSYGTKISDIPEDKYNEVMAKLAELEVSV